MESSGETEWKWNPVGDTCAPDGYRFALMELGKTEPICDITIPSSVIARALFHGRRVEIMMDAEEARLVATGVGFDDSLLDELTRALSGTRVLALASDLLECAGPSDHEDQTDTGHGLKEEYDRLYRAILAAQARSERH